MALRVRDNGAYAVNNKTAGARVAFRDRGRVQGSGLSGFPEGEGVADVLELRAVREPVDGEDIEADGNAGAVARRKLREVSGRQAAELALLGGVDLGFSGKEIARRAGLHFEDNERIAVPGDEIEVASDASGDPAARDDCVALRAEMKESIVLAKFAGEKMRGFGAFAGTGGAGSGTAVAERAQTKKGAAFESHKACADVLSEAEEAHGPML